MLLFNHFVTSLLILGFRISSTVVNSQDIIFKETNTLFKHGFPTTPTTMTSPMLPTDKCETFCVTLDFCPYLFKLLANPTVRNLEILREASCGFTPEGDPLVNCEDFLCEASRSARNSSTTTPNDVIFPTSTTEPSSRLDNNLFRNRLLNPLDNNEDCGIAFPSRINGGDAASKGEFPWIVAVAVHTSSGVQTICGGALIAENWAITAAHCVADSGHHARNISHIRVGAYNISDTTEEGAENIEVSQILFHENFRERPIVKHDIALLKLKQKVAIGASIGPICLPNKTDEELYYGPGISGTIAGWGSDGTKQGYNILQKVEVPIVPGDQCKSVFYRVRIRVLPELQVCAGETGKDSCKGDSGGPLMRILNGRTVLTGIISFGTVQCDGRLPGVYTKVTSYIDWIRDTIIKNS